MGTYLILMYHSYFMKIIGLQILYEFKERHPDAGSHIDAWIAEATAATWSQPLNIKQKYSSASILPENHVIFNIRGNRYRLKVLINYKNQIILIKKADTHDEYMKW